jgi:hypothetical protein
MKHNLPDLRRRQRSAYKSALPHWTVALAAGGLLATTLALRAEDPGVLPEQVVSSLTPMVLSGYVDASAIWRIGEASQSGAQKAFPYTYRSPGRLYDGPSKQNGINLDAISLTLERALDVAGWSAGYRAQLLAGPDYQLRNAHSLSGGAGEIGLHEAYVSLRAPLGNGLDFRVGYFTSPLGYEVYDAYRNPNFSRSYGYYIEPKAHTGVTMRYDFASWIGAMAGVGNNYSPFIDARADTESCKTYLGVLSLNGELFDRPDITLSLGYTGGNTAIAASTDSSPRIHNYYAGLRVPLPVKGLSVGVAYDYRANAGAREPQTFFEPAGPRSTYANATGLYVQYERNDWTFATRVEYASGSAGNTIFGSRGAFGSSKP